jgi:dihydropteroate synthase
MNISSFLGGKLDLRLPQVMGILNITDNSFCSHNRTLEPQHAFDIALTMQEEGAGIIDVGAEATNPHIDQNVSAQQELDRLIPVLELLQQHLKIPFSVDTSRPEVMSAAAKYGMGLINDVRALLLPGALETAASLNLPVCLMHMKFPFGKTTKLDQSNLANNSFLPAAGEGAGRRMRVDQGVFFEVKNFLEDRIAACVTAGISREKIIIDPGFGAGNFGKTHKENLQLLNRLDEFQILGLPILVGISRKIFIGEILGETPDKRLYGSIAAATIAVTKGAQIVRTHDVKATKDAITVAIEIMQEGKKDE